MGGLETTSELTDKRSNGLYVTEELSSESSLCGGIYLEKGREGEKEYHHHYYYFIKKKSIYYYFYKKYHHHHYYYYKTHVVQCMIQMSIIANDCFDAKPTKYRMLITCAS